MAWFSGGDNNSRFFHKLASNRKSVNSIWKIQIQQNETLTSLKDIQEEAVWHFSKKFQASTNANFRDQWELDNLLPFWLSEADYDHLVNQVTIEDLKVVLSELAKDKISRSDG